MHLLLFLAGLIFLVAGLAAVLLGAVAYRETGSTILITPGTVAAVGGFALLGLGSISRRLLRLGEMLETQPLPRSIAVPADDPVLREPMLGSDAVKPAFAATASETDSGRVTAAKEAPPVASAVAPAPAVAAAQPAASTAALAVAPPVVAPAAPPVAAEPPAAFSSRPEAPPVRSPVAPPPPAFETPAPAAPPVVAVPSPSLDGQVPPAAEPGDEEPRVLKSGVIEGMPYTLYSNGAVDAELPQQGTVRFASIAEWRAYIRADQ